MQANNTEIKELIEDEIELYTKKYGKDFKKALLKVIALEKMLMPITTYEPKESRLIPIAKWNEFHASPAVGTLYQYSSKKHKNGFDEVIEYGGEKGGIVLINEDKFFEWQRNRSKNKKLEK